ncbi:MAG: tetratricopeptide repeat protein [Desulfobacter sp.]|nr:MAG: tetratricopeptide repeat protein [Desulfobacter sp.]
MKAGNNGDFNKAFLNLEDALSLSRELDKKCLEAKLLNNIGILHTMNGRWDKAMAAYDESMDLVCDHYGTGNFLYKTLQKNIGYLFNLDVAA